jgi:glycosyltransferase involved in cell wall biosynthesis
MIIPTITATISTKNRYHTTLPLAISSIIHQTLPPTEFILFDDNDNPVDLRQDEVYQYLFALLDTKNIKWRVVFGKKEGQVKNHQLALELATGDLIWRLDDDNLPEPNVLETLVSNFDDTVGAVAGLVITPPCTPLPPKLTGKIEDIFSGDNIQWHTFQGKQEVDHLYSSFLFRKKAAIEAGGYCMELSKVGHREESLISYEMKRKGWKLIVDPKAITWHLRAKGGIRSETDVKLWEHDEAIFRRKMEEWKVKPVATNLIYLDNGLGDHCCLLNILPKIIEKHKDKKPVIACCYPEVFKDYDVQTISIADGKQIAAALGIPVDSFDVYKWCTDNNFSGHLIEAFAKIYGVEHEHTNSPLGQMRFRQTQS